MGDKEYNKIPPEIVFEHEEAEDSEERLLAIFDFLLGEDGHKEKENITNKIA